MALSNGARRLAVGGMLAAMVVVAPALAGPGKGYTVDLGGTAVAGRTVAFTATLSVPSSQQQQLGSARLTVPANYTVLDASVIAPATGAVSTTTDSATFEELGLQPGKSLTVQVRAMVPCADGGSQWIAVAKQANDFNGSGNDLTLNVAASDVATVVTGECTPCDDGSSADVCTDDQDIGAAKFTLSGVPDPVESDGGTLQLALNAGLEVTCPNYTPATSGTVLFEFLGNRSKTALLTVPKKSVPKGGLQFCFGSPDPATGLAQFQTFDWDGNGTQDPVYVKLLPDCVDAADPGPCVSARGKAGASPAFIEARLPQGDPGMRG